MSEQSVESLTNYYAPHYKEYTKTSLAEAVEGILKKHGKLDSITLDYWMRPKRYGGLGYGKPTKVGSRYTCPECQGFGKGGTTVGRDEWCTRCGGTGKIGPRTTRPYKAPAARKVSRKPRLTR